MLSLKICSLVILAMLLIQVYGSTTPVRRCGEKYCKIRGKGSNVHNGFATCVPGDSSKQCPNGCSCPQWVPGNNGVHYCCQRKQKGYNYGKYYNKKYQKQSS